MDFGESARRTPYVLSQPAAELIEDPMQAIQVLQETQSWAEPPSASKVDASPFRSLFTRGLDGEIQCVVTARLLELM